MSNAMAEQRTVTTRGSQQRQLGDGRRNHSTPRLYHTTSQSCEEDVKTKQKSASQANLLQKAENQVRLLKEQLVKAKDDVAKERSVNKGLRADLRQLRSEMIALKESSEEEVGLLQARHKDELQAAEERVRQESVKVTMLEVQLKEAICRQAEMSEKHRLLEDQNSKTSGELQQLRILMTALKESLDKQAMWFQGSHATEMKDAEDPLIQPLVEAIPVVDAALPVVSSDVPSSSSRPQGSCKRPRIIADLFVLENERYKTSRLELRVTMVESAEDRVLLKRLYRQHFHYWLCEAIDGKPSGQFAPEYFTGLVSLALYEWEDFQGHKKASEIVSATSIRFHSGPGVVTPFAEVLAFATSKKYRRQGKGRLMAAILRHFVQQKGMEWILLQAVTNVKSFWMKPDVGYQMFDFIDNAPEWLDDYMEENCIVFEDAAGLKCCVEQDGASIDECLLRLKQRAELELSLPGLPAKKFEAAAPPEGLPAKRTRQC